ncbi:MAG: glycosyltransferase family 4 protein [Elusimicrobia bacterium]|nr:glycosyltransferase family 4 protein [Elusimicrobiota bacterium]
MSRRKVLHIVTRLDLGGAQQNTLYTVGHMDPARFEMVLACGAGGVLDDEAKSLGVKVRFVEDLVREVSPLRDLTALFQLAQIIREENPDVVHTHSSKAGILGRLAARLVGVPYVIHTFHGFGFHDRMNALVKWVTVGIEKLAAEWSDRLIFVSKANMETARELGFVEDGNWSLIRSGVKLSALPAKVDREAKRRELGVRIHKPLVIGIGNLKPQKNAEDFLRVAEAALKEVPEACFIYIGDGPLRSKLEARIIARGMSGKVKLIGWRRDTAELLAASDVFLSTSLWEGLPRALVEAMKTRLGCACYAVDGIKDVLQDGVNGYAAPAGDWERLAAGTISLLKDAGLRERLGKAAAASIGQEFDIDEMVREQSRLIDRSFSSSENLH